MASLNSRPLLRWLVPVGAAVVLVGGGAAARTLSAEAAPELPARSAAQLLVDLQTARLDGLSGTVVQRADLGLPALPASLGQGSTNALSLLSGKHTLRVWYSGPDKMRVALLGTDGETDFIRNGRDAWVWNSKTNTASHESLPAGTPDSVPDALPQSPQQAADLALRAIDPSTEVTVGRNARVADRTAYELVLQPRDKGSLLGQIRLAIDSKEHVPLRVQVYPRDSQDIAFEVKFTQVSFARPDDGQFKFTPPPGVRIEEKSAGDAPSRTPDAAPDTDQVRRAVIGTGWTSVIVARTGNPADATKAADPNAPDVAGMLGGLPQVSGAWGSGRVFSTRLVTALITDDGRVLVGAVTPARLAEVAGDPAAQLK